MKAVVLLAVLAGPCVAVQTDLTAVAQRALGVPVFVAISGLTTRLAALVAALTLAKPDFTGRAVGYAVASGVPGAVIVGAVAIAAAQGGVARALSLVIASQLGFGLIPDALGVFGGGPDVGAMKVLGVALIIAGGVLVVRF
jgi:bacterial/archaeal transporter family-2 protein